MTTKSYVLIASATSVSGAGHVMRFLPLLRELKKRGVSVDIYGEITIPWLIREIRTNSLFGVYSVTKNYDIAISDSYDRNFLDLAHSNIKARRWIQILDGWTPIYKEYEGIWLDPNNPPIDIQNTLIASGLRFFPTSICSKSILNGIANRVLIQIGGSPKQNQVEAICNELTITKFANIEFIFFSNWVNPPKLKNFRFLNLGLDFFRYLNYCDTVICGSGTTIWESLMNHKIVGAVKVVENQTNNYNYVTSNNLALGLGSLESGEGIDSEAISRLLFDEVSRDFLFQNCQRDLDPNGAKRLVDEIMYQS